MKAKRGDVVPADLVRAALGSVGLSDDDLRHFMDALSARWPNVLRHRRGLSPADLPVETEPVDWYELARRYQLAGPDVSGRELKPSRCLAYAGADFYLQDAGSLLSLAAAGADDASLAGLQICDLCASPGGKATALVEAIGDDGFVLANEPIRSRLPPLAFNLARTGSDRYAVSCLDPESLADRLGGVFDLVLVDAPCSGQALLSRGRQNVSALAAKQIAHSAARQSRILDAAVRLLRPGGRLVYSTCTFAEAENEAQVERLTENGMARPHLVERLDAYRSCRDGCYRLWPHLHQCAGSFTASLVCDGGNAEEERRVKKRKTHKPPVDLTQWFQPLGESSRLWQIESVLIGWPSDAPLWLEDVAITGPELAHRTGQTWKPSHAAAQRRVPRGCTLQSIDVAADVAKRFLTGDTIPCQDEGWLVVRFAGRPIGWIKADGSIGKNHLPTAARMAGEIAG